MKTTKLTKTEIKLMSFIKDYLQKHSYSPTFEEIKDHFHWSSYSTVDKYTKSLKKKGHLGSGKTNSKRSLFLIDVPKVSQKNLLSLQLFGAVYAGGPTEMFEDHHELIDVPEWLLPSPYGEYGCLKVQGNSMIEKGIHDGDTIVIRKQNTAENGQIVVAAVNGEKTLKQFFSHPDKIELRPFNADLEPIFVSTKCDNLKEDEQRFQIEGVYCGLLRKA